MQDDANDAVLPFVVSHKLGDERKSLASGEANSIDMRASPTMFYVHAIHSSRGVEGKTY